MKKFVMPFVLVALAAFSAGCSNPKDANKENFAKAAQAYLDTTYPRCYVTSNFPKKERIYEGKESKSIYHALAAAGILSERVSEKAEKIAFLSSSYTEYEYDLTEEGKKFYREGIAETFGGDSVGGICFGKAKVSSIENFTEPSDMMGMRVSRVSYRYNVEDIPEWAKSAEVTAASSTIKEDVESDKKPIENMAGFILTDKGWMHERLFRQ